MGELNQTLQKREWGSNVRKIAVIRLLQCKMLYIGLILFLAQAVSLDLFLFFVQYKEGRGYSVVYEIGNIPYYTAFFFIALFVLGSYTILSDDKISMYPGTVTSRFCARLCSDYLIILGFTLLYGGFYAVNSMILHLLAWRESNLNVRNTFSIPYLFTGMLQMFCGCLFLYSLFVLCYTFFTKIKEITSTVLTVVAILLANWLTSTEKLDLYWIWDLLTGKNMALGTYLFFLLAGWGICTVLSFLIACMVGSYKKQSYYLLWIVLTGVSLGGSTCIKVQQSLLIYGGDAITDERYSFQIKELRKDFIFSFNDVKQGSQMIDQIMEEGIEQKEEGYRLPFSQVAVLTEKEARKEGYLEPDYSLTENQMLFRVVAHNISYRNQYIYENTIKSLDIYQEGHAVFWKRERCGNVISTAFGKDYQKCHDTEYNINLYLEGWPGDRLQAILVVDETLMEIWEQKNSDE